MPRVRVGCSGWHYRDWRGRFSPQDAPTSEWLAIERQPFLARRQVDEHVQRGHAALSAARSASSRVVNDPAVATES